MKTYSAMPIHNKRKQFRLSCLVAWTAAIWCLLVAAASFLASINVWTLTIDFYYLDNDGITSFGCNANEIFKIWHSLIPLGLWWGYAVAMLSIATYISLKRSWGVLATYIVVSVAFFYLWISMQIGISDGLEVGLTQFVDNGTVQCLNNAVDNAYKRLGLVDLLGMAYALVSLVFIGMPRFMAIVREEWTRMKAK